MKAVKRTLVVLGAMVALVLAALLLVPVLFRDAIVARVKTGINDAVAARVDWSGAGLTFFRNFPNLTLRLDDLTVQGVDRFDNDTLAAIRQLRVVLDMGSVMRGLRKGEQIVVRSIDVNQPVLHLRVLEDGTANWNITKPSTDTVADGGRNFNIGLRSLDIRDATITLANEQVGLTAALNGFTHSLSGDFTRDRSTLKTKTHSDAVTVTFAGVTYLNGVALDVTADVDADMANGTFTFGDNQVKLNDLMLGFTGSVARAGEDVRLDVKFAAPQTDARQILSLVPAIYAKDFASLQASGTVAVNGVVNGLYGPSAFPAFSVHAKIDDAGFKYPDLPLAARNISLDLSIDNAGGDVDSTVVRLERFHIELGDDPVDATLVVRTPVSDPDIDLRLNGRLDLANLGRTVKLDSIQELRGIVTADVAVRTRMSAIEGEQYDHIAASGSASVREMELRKTDLPHALAIDEMMLRLTPRRAELTSFRGRIGSSDLQLTGHLDNLLGFALRNEDLRGRADVTSQVFNLDEWQSKKTERSVIPVPARLDVAVEAVVAQLTYGKLQMSNARGTLRVKDQRLTIDGFNLSTLGGRVAMSGYYETADIAKPTFDLAFAVDSLDIPGAFGAIATVQKFAPVAQFARGTFSAEFDMNGVLGGDMMPLFDVLNGVGSILTSRVQLQGFPAMNSIADQLKLQQLKDPAVSGLRSSIAIQGGRLHVKPFGVSIGESKLTVGGSNGIDQSLQYTLALAVPRRLLGSEADRVVNSLIAQTGRAGLTLQPSDVIELGIDLTGTITNPTIRTNFGGIATSATAGLQKSVEQALNQRVDAAAQRVDSAKAEARRQAQAEADRIVREAEERAVVIRAEARKVAEDVKAAGNKQADELLARATNPIAQAAARPAADRLRREADAKAVQIVAEADRRADELVEESKKKAAALVGGASS